MLPFEFPRTLGKEIILPVYMNHSVFQYTLPFIFHTRHLVVSAKNDIRFTGCALLGVFFALRVRIIEVTIDGLRIGL